MFPDYPGHKAISCAYTDLRQAGSRFLGDGIVRGVEERGGEAFHGFGGIDDHVGEGLQYRHSTKNLSFAERYDEHGLGLCFLLARGKVAKDERFPNAEKFYVLRAVKNDQVAKLFDTGVDEVGKWIALRPGSEDGSLAAQDQEPVLVLHIKGMDQRQAGVPSVVRLEVGYGFDDLFAGDLYLSILDGRYKSLRLFREGKMDLRFDMPRHSKEGLIERRAEIVDGIPDDEREGWRDGILYFDNVGQLSGLAVAALHQSEGPVRKEGFDLGIEVVDVMTGPL